MKDQLQLIAQVVLIGLGPVLAKHGVTVGNADVDQILGGLSLLGGIIWKFWHWNATPSATPAAVAIKQIVSALALMAVASFFILGCAQLAPGADPIVVRVEQFEETAKPTFDLTLSVDQSLGTNSPPAFHNFCAWLSAPQTVEQTNTLPRCYAMLLSLDDVKLNYKAARVSSNAVFTALATGQSMLNQASSYLSLVTNSATK